MFSSYFTAKELVYLFQVSKTWLDTLRDGNIWKKLFEKKWSTIVSVEAKIKEDEITVGFITFFKLKIFPERSLH